MALKKTFDLGDISFGESQTKSSSNVTEIVNDNPASESPKVKEEAEIKEKKEESVSKSKDDRKKEENAEVVGVKLITNKKNLKTEHKNFLFDKELADQLKKVAKKTGLSENEVVSQILKQTLSQLLDG